MKKVLVALDYNPSAQTVAEVGYELAKAMNAEVVLLHVIADTTYYSSLEYSPVMGFGGFSSNAFFNLINTNGLTEAAQYYLDKVKHHLHNSDLETLVEEGESAEAILKTAKNHHADMIVMGSHSRNWLNQVVMGSVTKEVLKDTSVPMLIIPVKEPKS